MAKVFEVIENKNSSFKVLKILEKADVWPEFAKLFGGKL
jgi:uncharacterized sporulation protein YeaH/YhbH (DUF444 family)